MTAALPFAPSRPARRPDSGVTLVEILVSLSIVGAVASLAMLSIRPEGGGRSVEMEARKLAGLVDLAANEALTTGGRIVFEWDETGYAFAGVDAPGLTGRRDIAGGIALAGTGTAEDDAREHAIGGAFGDAFTLILGEGGARWRVEFDGVSARATRDGIGARAERATL